MPRGRPVRANATGVFVWPVSRRRSVTSMSVAEASAAVAEPAPAAAAPEPVAQPEMGKSESSVRLDLVRLSGDDGWHYGILHGRKEIGRLCRYPDGAWRW